MKYQKKYIDVVSLSRKDGEVTPIFVCWDDGSKYRIDKVISRDIRGLENGECIVRYECLMSGQRKILFQETDRWFIQTMQMH